MAATSKADRDRNQRIREWGTAHGWAGLSDRGPIPAGLRSQYATAEAGIAVETADSPRPPDYPPGPVIFSVPELPGDDAGPGATPVDAGAGDTDPTAEPPPQPPRRPLGDRLRDAVGKHTDEQVRKPKRGGRARPRLSLEELAGAAWAGLTAIIARLGGDQFAPVASCMAFEEPVAGMVLDGAINGTVIDRPAQAIARFLESGTDAALLVGPPVVVGGVCAGMIPYPAGRAILGKMLRSWIIMAGPKIRALAEREQQFAEEMAQMAMPGPDGEPVPVSLDDLIDTIFGPLAFDQERARAGANGHQG